MTNEYLRWEPFDQLKQRIKDCAFVKERNGAERVMMLAKSLRSEGRITKEQHQELRSIFNKSFPRK